MSIPLVTSFQVVVAYNMWKKAQASEASNASLQASLKKEGRESGASASAGDSASANASDLASCTWLGELEVVRRTRPKAQPNIGFAAELLILSTFLLYES